MQIRTFGIKFNSIAVRNIAAEGEQKSVIAQGGVVTNVAESLTHPVGALYEAKERTYKVLFPHAKGFVIVLMFKFSVATTSIHHLSCKSHIKNKCLNI